ncbi:nicotinate (nicotinamide) nucleotide adenylyltransferase [Luteolibacter ambystomatis]|uniref:Probable nicotinate-nucleotide adenylyltransferase n=1 Tax=Luteolibacter ambystomatis TaxID=2824561 RepID=A0A975J1I3_9BACT|nr:nicotinate (nicotinamide) nucleotide adenylyltransferase [Luteolibacter ambystomatis]QUE52312.1 nicotinate (nicotinamide) nucleotide adenylyltransferase [Luteolibacter ambystomatis]
MSEPRRIALFGGTFDPVHLGHIHLAERAREAAGLDEVRFLPCRISPHKTGSEAAPGRDRLEMLRLATRELPWAAVDEYELNGPEPSFSYLTAEAMAAREPEACWFWLMGGDQWEALPRWRHPERLAAVVTFLVLARGTDIPRGRPGFRMKVVTGDHPASSTLIRHSAEGGKLREEWLQPAVADYISKHDLYRH